MIDLQLFHGRRAAFLENDALRVVVLEGGGHIAAVIDKASGVTPLWVPPWPSIEPSDYSPAHHQLYGSGVDGKLLAGIMGHNLCLDCFGPPSAEEARAGLTAHGEGSVATYALDSDGSCLHVAADLPLAGMRVERQLTLEDRLVRVRETVANLAATDRPVGWTQHVTLGPPFLVRGTTEFRASATRSRVFDSAFGVADYLKPGTEFEWPHAPRQDGGVADLRRYTAAPSSSAYTAHLMDQQRAEAFFVAFSPELQLAFGYVWRSADFPWLGLWDENNSRTVSPWNGTTLTRGLEFGASPFPESRRQMVERGRLFGVPTFMWLPAHTSVTVDYAVVCRPAAAIPEQLP